MKHIFPALIIFLGGVSAHVSAATITPAEFTSQASISTFENLGLSETFETPAVIDGNTYEADGGVLRYEATEDCYSGHCLGTHQPNSHVYITLGSAANRVGIYLGGTLDPGDQAMTIYDHNGNPIESWSGALQIKNNLYFIGLESLQTDIHSIRLFLSYGQFSSRFDNLTLEAIPIPPSIWLFGSGVLALFGMRKKTPPRSPGRGCLRGL